MAHRLRFHFGSHITHFKFQRIDTVTQLPAPAPTTACAPVSTLAGCDDVADVSMHFDKGSVAELSLCEIEAMSRDDLLNAIRAVIMPFVDDDRLEFQDRRTLLRLLYLARQSCRNQGH